MNNNLWIRDSLNAQQAITERRKNKDGKEVYVVTYKIPKSLENRSKRGAIYKSTINEFGEWSAKEIAPAPKEQRNEKVRMRYDKNGIPIFEDV